MQACLRSAVWLVAAWLLFDLSMPFFPGAFQFDPDDSVEAVGASHESADLVDGERPPAPSLPSMRWWHDQAPTANARLTAPRARHVRRVPPRRHDDERAAAPRPPDPA